MPPETLPLAATCPRCLTEVGPGESCGTCDLAFVRNGGILDTLGPSERESQAAEVESFYTESPFPGYAPGDDGPTLLDRSRRSAFLAALDRAIPPDSDVVDCGCGTGQTAAFLALAGPRRRVFGIDGCRRSLECADGFRTKVGLKNLQLVRGDLFDLPARPGSFPVVVSRGVVHHTPDPAEAIRRVAALVAPGGILVLGFYETWARLLHCARRGVSKLTGNPPAFLDPVLRRRDLDPEKKRIWIQDQYRHPLEHILPLPWVLDVLRETGLTWVRSVPPAPPAEGMFEPTAEMSRAARTSMRLGWMARGLGDPDAGLVCVVARRPE